MEKIAILNKKRQVNKTRSLYESVFQEDTKAFIDYYYREKTKDNRAYVYSADKVYLAMLHLNPYQVECTLGRRITEKEVPYLVAVATQKEHRRKGIMNKLLTKAISDMEAEGKPFMFLMPAKPEIYTPYQFTYIYDREEYKIADTGITKKFLATILQDKQTVGVFPKGMETLWVRMARIEDNKVLEAFCEEVMQKKYDVYTKRDQVYFAKMQKELKSQNGAIFLIENRENLLSYFFYTPEKHFIQEAQVREGYKMEDFLVVKKKKKPIIMARILNLEQMGNWIKSKKENDSESCLIQIEDPIIEHNHGLFQWTLTANGSSFEEITELDSIEEDPMIISIQDLTSYLFGYQSAEECVANLTKKQKDFLEHVETLKNPYFNEIV